ncbi:MAG TPA: amino acid adenylation domain-containing protein, partial [Thermoanaerobaculia bacterium]|nr:amino acid adenylation domain-containing protein [Thermoanaerobaculia bacterium]
RLGLRFAALLEAAVANPGRPIGDLPLLLAAERQQVLEWNATRTAYPRESSLPERFASVVAERPDAVAVVDEDGAHSYGRLDEASSRLAGYLESRGIGAGDRVGVSMGRSADLVVALLGILKAGAAYVPLDPGYPDERLAFLTEDAGIATVLKAPVAGDLAAPRQVPAESLAYVIYTSGSTGQPKGVAVSHRAVLRLVTGDYLTLRPDDRLAFNANTSFDAATFEIWATLLQGATLVVIPQDVLLSPPDLAARLEREDVTVLHLTAALFAQMVPAALGRLRCALFGGEASAPAAVARVLEGGRPQRLLHMYGPTESTTFATWHEVTDAAALPIGRPLANTTAYVLDRRQQPVPPGVTGELCLGGDGLAWGYLNRPDLTAERFVPDPFGEPGARLYRTGDLASVRADGALELQGRIDHQVKIRGFRIEPGEVEAVLAAHPAVRECAVVARRDAGVRLVAYVVGDAGDLRGYLQERLPDYMVPSAFVALEALPLTPNGKVDRKALPAPDAVNVSAGSEPLDLVEELLAGIWAEVLGLGRVGVHDDFFALGGHSLLATQVVSRVRAVLGVELPLRALFESPTVAGLGQSLRTVRESGEGQAPPIAPVPRDGDLPLSFAQQRLWFLDQLEPGSAAYNMPLAVRLTGEVDPARLAGIFGEIARRHEALRTTFTSRAGTPVQVIALPSVELPVVDLSQVPESEALRLAREEALRPFNLERGPLLRLTLLRLDLRDHLLFLTLHHIVSDGWSMGVLLREIAALYAGSPLPELPLQYADYAAWQRSWLQGEVLESHLAYWRRQLEGAPRVLELPTDRPRPAVQTFRGAALPASLPAERVRELCRQAGATPFMVLLAAWPALLGRHAGQPEVLVGTPIAGRNRREIEGLIGFFVNTLALRADLSDAPDFATLLGRVRRTALEAFTHQDLPFDRLVEELVPERDLSRSPLFQVVFVLQNAPGGRLELPDLTLAPVAVEVRTTKFDLTLSLQEGAGGFTGVLEYNTDLFDASTAARLLARFETLLEGATGNPGLTLPDLPLLLESERQQALLEWNDAWSDYPRESSLPALFAAVARSVPEAPAVVSGDEVWSYRRLDEASSRLARRLGPEPVVGIAMERSPELIVGILAILKAGGAYMPLDVEYPDERLAFMLADTGAEVVLVHERTRQRMEGLARLLSVDEGEDGEPFAEEVPAESLALLIYTSGSTGRPKGVALAHRGIVRLVRETNYLRLGPGDRMGHAANISFDAATLEIWSALLNGAALVVIPRETALSPAALAAQIQKDKVTALFLTTALFHQVAREAPEAFASLHTVMFGGEAADPVAVARVAGPALVHLYGPAESTTLATWHRVLEVPAGAVTVPIGLPVANSSVYVLDRWQGLVPPGVVGELCAGGDGLARGYLGRPDLTAERFIPHPWGVGEGGERLYRTGDLARQRPDGAIEFVGRGDDQVKIRGFRIELGEVEAVMLAHPAVRDGVVLAREDRGGRRLVAWVVGDADEPVLRAWLRERLPDYMVPSAFVMLEALPLTPNGKVDRRALPEPTRPVGIDEAPLDLVEELLAGI